MSSCVEGVRFFSRVHPKMYRCLGRSKVGLSRGLRLRGRQLTALGSGRFRLHEPGVDEEQLLQGLPSMAEVEHFARYWKQRVPCPDPWAPVEGFYILSLYGRARRRVYFGRYETKRLMEHVLWTSCIRPSFEGEELLPAPTILLATYGTAFFRQKDVFLKLLAPLQEALRLDGTLMPNEVSKLAWMFSAARVYEHEMIPVVGDLALRTSDMRPTHLAQVSNGLGRILAAPNMEESILPTLQRVLRPGEDTRPDRRPQVDGRELSRSARRRDPYLGLAQLSFDWARGG